MRSENRARETILNSAFITAYERDNETELDFAQARYHDYNHGRFTSPDPVMASARKANPQTFNRYSYVTNNPLNLIDPLGLSGCDPKTDPNCAQNGPLDGQKVKDADGSMPGIIASVTIVASQEAIAIATTITQISTQITQRTLQSLPSMSEVLTGMAGKSVGVAGVVLTPLPNSGLSDCMAATANELCGNPQRDYNREPQIEPFPISPTTTGTPEGSNTFYHYTTATPENFVNGMLPGSSATTRGDLYSNQASQGLGIPPPSLVYPVTINPKVTTVIDGGDVDSSRRYPGGLPQVYFPNGTPPGSVGPPRTVPR